MHEWCENDEVSWMNKSDERKVDEKKAKETVEMWYEDLIKENAAQLEPQVWSIWKEFYEEEFD